MNPSDAVVPKLVALLEDFTQDWDNSFEGTMDRNTKLFADLGFESIDIIQLIVAIQQDVVKSQRPFEKMLMREGRYVDDLSIGQIADFIAQPAA